MGDQHRGAAVTGQHPAQHFAHRGGGGDVQSGQRLVEQQHVGFGGQRPSQRHPLGLPAGQLPRHPVGEFGRIDLGRARCRRRRTAKLRGANATLRGDVEVREQQRVLQQQADTTIVGGDVHPRRGVGQHAVVRRAPARGPAAPGPRSRAALSTCPHRWVRAAASTSPAAMSNSMSTPRLATTARTRNTGHDGLPRIGRPATGGCPARRRQRRPPRPAAATARPPRRRRFRAAGRSPAAAFG